MGLSSRRHVFGSCTREFCGCVSAFDNFGNKKKKLRFLNFCSLWDRVSQVDQSILFCVKLYEMGLQSIYGDLCILLRIYLSKPVWLLAGSERAFSKLKLIKNDLRSKMSQERLNGLAMLSIEHKLAKKLDFNDLIDDFATTKVWRMAFRT